MQESWHCTKPKYLWNTFNRPNNDKRKLNALWLDQLTWEKWVMEILVVLCIQQRLHGDFCWIMIFIVFDWSQNFYIFPKKKSEKNICRNEKNLPFLISHCKFVANLTEIGSLVLAEKYQIENKNLLEWTQNGLTQRTGDFTICFDYGKIEEVLVKTNWMTRTTWRSHTQCKQLPCLLYNTYTHTHT